MSIQPQNEKERGGADKTPCQVASLGYRERGYVVGRVVRLIGEATDNGYPAATVAWACSPDDWDPVSFADNTIQHAHVFPTIADARNYVRLDDTPYLYIIYQAMGPEPAAVRLLSRADVAVASLRENETYRVFRILPKEAPCNTQIEFLHAPASQGGATLAWVENEHSATVYRDPTLAADVMAKASADAALRDGQVFAKVVRTAGPASIAFTSLHYQGIGVNSVREVSIADFEAGAWFSRPPSRFYEPEKEQADES